MPIPVNQPDPNFLEHIDKFEEVSEAAAKASLLDGQRKWAYPPLNGWNGDPQAITDMNKAFDRNDLNAQYQELIKDKTQEGKIGEVMVTKLQVDYIAAAERAFRTRHCSSVRARLHSAARRRGQGDKKGIFTGGVVLHLQRLLDAAHKEA
jgi:hypothetical protein